jgi:hypothetical protein
MAFLTALQAEKYCRFPTDDPLYALAHSALPPKRLKRSSWQYFSQEVLQQLGLSDAHNDDHTPTPCLPTPLILYS